MSRIATPNSIDAAPAQAQPLLAAVKQQLGSVPNMFRLIATSPAALEGYLGLNGALGKGRLDAKTRGRIALVVAEENGCGYCLSAHTALGKGLKLDDAELDGNRYGRSSDGKAEAALRFARDIVRERGHVPAAAVDAVKAAGYDDAQVVEIILHVALNTLTNYVNTALATEVDFPLVAPAKAAYGGLCAVAMAGGERVPSDATSVSSYDGRIFRFSSPKAQAMFDAEPATFIAKADANWSRLS